MVNYTPPAAAKKVPYTRLLRLFGGVCLGATSNCKIKQSGVIPFSSPVDRFETKSDPGWLILSKIEVHSESLSGFSCVFPPRGQ